MDKLAATRLGKEILKKMTGASGSPLSASFKQIARSGPKRLEKDSIGWSKELHRQASSQPGYVKKPLQKEAATFKLPKGSVKRIRMNAELKPTPSMKGGSAEFKQEAKRLHAASSKAKATEKEMAAKRPDKPKLSNNKYLQRAAVIAGTGGAIYGVHKADQKYTG